MSEDDTKSPTLTTIFLVRPAPANDIVRMSIAQARTQKSNRVRRVLELTPVPIALLMIAFVITSMLKHCEIRNVERDCVCLNQDCTVKECKVS